MDPRNAAPAPMPDPVAGTPPAGEGAAAAGDAPYEASSPEVRARLTEMGRQNQELRRQMAEQSAAHQQLAQGYQAVAQRQAATEAYLAQSQRAAREAAMEQLPPGERAEARTKLLQQDFDRLAQSVTQAPAPQAAPQGGADQWTPQQWQAYLQREGDAMLRSANEYYGLQGTADALTWDDLQEAPAAFESARGFQGAVQARGQDRYRRRQQGGDMARKSAPQDPVASAVQTEVSKLRAELGL